MTADRNGNFRYWVNVHKFAFLEHSSKKCKMSLCKLLHLVAFTMLYRYIVDTFSFVGLWSSEDFNENLKWTQVKFFHVDYTCSKRKNKFVLHLQVQICEHLRSNAKFPYTTHLSAVKKKNSQNVSVSFVSFEGNSVKPLATKN